MQKRRPTLFHFPTKIKPLSRKRRRVFFGQARKRLHHSFRGTEKDSFFFGETGAFVKQKEFCCLPQNHRSRTMLTRDSHEPFLRFFFFFWSSEKNHLGPFGIRGRGCCRCNHLLAGKELEEDVEREKCAVFPCAHERNSGRRWKKG